MELLAPSKQLSSSSSFMGCCSYDVFLLSSSPSATLSSHGFLSTTPLQLACSLLGAVRGSSYSTDAAAGHTRTAAARASSYNKLQKWQALQGAEAIVSPELFRLTNNVHILTDANIGSVEHHPQNDYKPPPPQLGNPSISTSPHPVRETCDSWLISTLKPQNDAYKQFLIQSMHPLFVSLTIPTGLPSRILPICNSSLGSSSSTTLATSSSSCPTTSCPRRNTMISFCLSLKTGLSPLARNGMRSSRSCRLSSLTFGPRSNRQCRSDNKRGSSTSSIDATLTQSKKRDEQGIVDLDTYLSFRKYTREGYMFMILAEYGSGLDLDEVVLSHPDIVKLHEMVAYHVSYVNDLLSFRKEFCLGHHQNLRSILCVHEGYNMQESIFRVCRMIQGLDDEFVSLKKVRMNEELVGREGVKEYLEVLGYVMSGFLEWAYQTGRYHGLNNHLLRSGLVNLVHLDLTLITQGVVKSELFADY
ncbi:hypothetical protein L7F22_063307 [Adiantum nelumboides]|nr:hypothetical protein [Adiantum nelumboides]